MIDPFGKLVRDVRKYLQDEEFAAFHGILSPNADVTWAENSDWKEFLRAARRQGASLIVISETRTPDSSDVELEASAIRSELKKHTGQTCALTLAWVKEGVRYGLKLEASWWRKAKSLLESDEWQRRIEQQREETEERTVESLIPEIVKSTVRRKETKITQADIHRYLDERRIRLPYPVAREIWRKVNLEIKRHSSSRSPARTASSKFCGHRNKAKGR